MAAEIRALPPSCALDEAGAVEQRERYARLAASVERLRRQPDSLVVEFDDEFDHRLLEETLAVERECCPFFRFAFNERDRQLRVTVADEATRPALDALAYGFGESGAA